MGIKNPPIALGNTEIEIKCDKCGLTWWHPVNALPASCPNCYQYKTHKQERPEDTIRKMVRDLNDLFSQATFNHEYDRGKSHFFRNYEEIRIHTYSAGDPECDIALNTILMKEGDKACHINARYASSQQRMGFQKSKSFRREERKPTQHTTPRQNRRSSRRGGR